MEFDRYTITLLVANPDAPELDEETAAAMQDAHMAHLADLHAAGVLLAAGPLSDERLRGLSILNVDPERARELKEQDPAVQAGLFTIEAIPWIVPAGAISFSPTFFPRSVADVRG
ncbi:MAG TPA: YciI family protein [Gaiellaceae bacterium]